MTTGSSNAGPTHRLVEAGVTLLIALADMNGAAAIGLYLTLFAGLAWVAAVIWDVRLGRTSAREPA